MNSPTYEVHELSTGYHVGTDMRDAFLAVLSDTASPVEAGPMSIQIAGEVSRLARKEALEEAAVIADRLGASEIARMIRSRAKRSRKSK